MKYVARLPFSFLCLFTILISVQLQAQSNNGVPFLNQGLSPGGAVPATPGFTLTLTGVGFAPNAVVEWNGSPRLTQVISSTEIKANIDRHRKRPSFWHVLETAFEKLWSFERCLQGFTIPSFWNKEHLQVSDVPH